MRKLLVANRGEIAVRVIRAARELGIPTVAVYSKADRHALPVQLADEALEIGPPQVSKSYLNIDALLDAARRSGADAVHPGYGFVSENAEFVRRVEQAGLTFVGPTAESIAVMGDKAAARSAARRAGVPCVPGSDGVVSGAQEALTVGTRIGFPVMIKASAGGGGRGIRVAADAESLAHQMEMAQAEARSAFGNGA